jgi:WD40 repeat protein/tRNA A-37 threonylcarbamoyl transferase component Bud32
MTHALAAHPDDGQLARFRLGTLCPDELEEIASHVAGCASCCQSLRQLPDDSLVGLVRQSLPAADTEEKSALPADLIDHPRYEVLELLGSGGMGSVYKARHRLMDRLVALKVIKRRLTDRPGMVERFRREMKAAGDLLHSNIVTAHDAEQAGATHFLVMEYVEGVTLAQHVADHGPLAVAPACDCVRQTALALQHAHERGMVHRDIKPHNLMRTGDGRIKVLDFGLARFASEVRPAEDESAIQGDAGGDDLVTRAGVVLGTVAYIAPEQLRDPHAADIRADIYSLGRTLMFLLNGHPPSSEGTAMKELLDIKGRMPPARLVPILDRLLATDPNQRYQTPAEVAAALAPFAAPRPKRRRFALVLALALLLMIGGGLAAAIYRVATDKGEIVIETEDPDIEVVIRQGGKEVTILDPKTQQKIALRSGDYEVALSGASGDLRLSTRNFTLKRGEKKIVVVKHEIPFQQPVTTWQNQTWQSDQLRLGQFVPPNYAELHWMTKPVQPTPLTPSDEPITELRSFKGHTDGVYSVAFSPAGKIALSGAALTDTDPLVRLWDVGSGKEIRRLAGPTAGVMSVAFSPNGIHALAGSDDKTIHIWDVATGRQVRVFEGHTDKVLAVAYSPAGKLIVSGSRDKTVRLWDAEAGKVLHTMKGHTDAVRTVAFAPDGQRVASGSFDGAVRIWNVADGKAVATPSTLGHPNGVQSVAFSPDGKRLASGGLDGWIDFWDVSSGARIARINSHPKGVATVAFTPDGRHILSGGHDGQMFLWDAATGARLRRFTGHKGAVRGLAISRDGRLALSGGDDKLVRLWQLPK